MGWLWVDDLLLQLLIYLLGRLLDSRRVLRAAEGLGYRLICGGWRWLLEATCGRSALCLLVIVLCGILFLFNDVAEDVVKNKVTVGLTGEDEGLGEFLVGLGLVRDLTDDLDDDVGVGGLRVDIGDANLAISEVEVLDVLIDSLASVSVDAVGCNP